MDAATWTRLGASNVFTRTVYLDLECSISREDVGEHAWSTYPHHFLRLPTAASPLSYWDLVADRSPKDIKVLGPLIPVSLMGPARKAEVAPDLT